MKELVKLQKIELERDSRKIFEIEQLVIKSESIIGIVGGNGSGKSTLLSLLAFEEEGYQGQLVTELKAEEIILVKQEVAAIGDSGFSDRVGSQIKEWQRLEGYEALSGGEKLKKRLSNGLGKVGSLLLLDEPTNHLDEKSVSELVLELQNYRGTVVVVSHDRQFLDQVATEIWSIEDQVVTSYPGNYSQFKQLREQERAQQANEFSKQQKEIRKIQGEMTRLTNWSEKAHRESTSPNKSESKMGSKEYFRMKAKKMDRQRKSIEKRLLADLADKTVERVKDEAQVSFNLLEGQRKQGPLYLVNHLSKSLGTKKLFEDAQLTVQYGDHLGIIGDNGSGKSTLLKILLGELTFEGSVWRSPSAQIGYLSQEVLDLPEEVTVADYLDVPRSAESQAKTLFVNLGFKIEQWQVVIKYLSMGERVKLKLVAHIIQEKNVLILDEPTNHLDLPSREQLEKVLKAYEGTLIVVSHDPYFREQVSQRTLEIRQGKLIDPTVTSQTGTNSDKMLLEFKKAELLATLSSQPATSSAYQVADQEFQKVLEELKNIKELL